MKRVLVLDVSSILHAAKHSVGKKVKLSYNEQYTFVIYGFLFKLRSILLKTRPDIVVFAIDSKRSIRKEKYYPKYKEKRTKKDKTPEEEHLDKISYVQFNEVTKNIIPGLGYKNVFEADGYEADDIIARIVKKYIHYKMCIVTSDADMYQLLCERIVIMSPRNYTYYSDKDFTKEYGIKPKLWEKVKMYGGCSSDCVPGIRMKNTPPKKPTNKPPKRTVRHVAEKNAINFVAKKLSTNTSAYRAFFDPNNKPIILRNKILTTIPLPGTPDFDIVEDRSLSKQALVDMCRKYGFKTIMEDLDEFCKVLRLR